MNDPTFDLQALARAQHEPLDPLKVVVDQRVDEVEAEQAKKPGDTAAFTEGEMLPWKGRWFRLHLTKFEGVFALEMIKPTERSQKLAARKIRWQEQRQVSKREVALHV